MHVNLHTYVVKFACENRLMLTRNMIFYDLTSKLKRKNFKLDENVVYGWEHLSAEASNSFDNEKVLVSLVRYDVHIYFCKCKTIASNM